MPTPGNQGEPRGGQLRLHLPRVGGPHELVRFAPEDFDGWLHFAEPSVQEVVRGYLEKVLGLDEPARNRWVAHWSLKALEALEEHLAHEPETGRYCHGDALTLADVCVASQVIAAKDYGRCDVSGVPVVMRIYGECMQLDAFARSHPQRQPGAPADLRA